MHPRSPSTSTFAFTSTCKALAVAAVIALALSLTGPALGAVAVEAIVLDNARYLRWSAEDATSPYLTRTFNGLVMSIDADGDLFASSSSSGADEVWPMDSPTALWTFASEHTMIGTHNGETGEIQGTFDFSGNVSSSTIWEREGKEPLNLQNRYRFTYEGTFFRQTSKETNATIIEFRGTQTSVGEAQNIRLEWEPTSGSDDRTYRVAFDPLLPTTAAVDPSTPDTSDSSDSADSSTSPDSAENPDTAAEDIGASAQPATVVQEEEGSGANPDADSSGSPTAAIIAAVAVIAALLAAFIIGLNARGKSKTTSKDPSADPARDPDGDEEEEEQSTIKLGLTHPAGQSPNVFTSGWVFGARAISNAGGPNEKDISDGVMWSGSGTFRPNTGSRSRPIFATPGTNQIILSVEADGRSVTRSFNVSAVSPAGFAHVGSSALCPTDSHGCPACPHLGVVGTVQTGSTVVTVDGQPAARVGDGGTHASCCGPNTFTIANGDASVLIEGRPAARLGSATTHCGGTGQLTT